MKPLRKILVVCLAPLDDVAAMLPVIYSAARQHAGVQIDVLAQPLPARIFVGAPQNVTVTEAGSGGRSFGLAGALRLAFGVSRGGYDAVADLHSCPRSQIVCRAARLRGAIVAVADLQLKRRRALLNARQQQVPVGDCYADVFAGIGMPVRPDSGPVVSADRLPSVPVVMEGPCIGIAPFARHRSQTLSPDTMRMLVGQLAYGGWNVWLFGGKADGEVLSQWAADMPQCVSLAGGYTAEEQMAIMARLDVVVSMDSVYQHLASLVGTRAVTVWGSTTPLCGRLGYGQSADDAVCRSLPCQPCSVEGLRGDCPRRFACLNQIDANDILRKIERMR